MNKHIRLILLILILPFALNAQKNVVLITVDDLNDWVGAFDGHPQAHTPNIDKLAQKGVAFQNASCSSPVCNPSRTALMTGRRPHETGYDNNNGANNAKHFRDNPNNWIKNLTTLPQYFGQQGYKTVSKGKLFHKPDESNGEFQTVGPKSQGASKGSDSQVISNTDGKLEWSRSNESLQNTGDFASANYGANFLNKTHNKPFFLGVGIFRPHIPLHAPKEFYNKVPAIDDIILPPLFKVNDRNDTYGSSNKYRNAIINDGGERRWKEWTRAYLANIAFADACVGHLLDALENSAYANNTIVVLVGDHGWHMGEKDHVLKFTLWDRAIKTPMIIYDPSAGSGNCNKAVSLQDIYPTLIELAGLQQPSFTLRGRSLKTLVENPSSDWCGAALTTYSGSNSIRSDRYRYIKYKNGKEELYDHQNDPGEWNNLENSATHQQVLTEMRQALTKMLNFNENPFGGSCPGDDNYNLPGDITNLSVVNDNCNGTILSWGDTDGEDSYRIRRKKVGETTFTNIADIQSNETIYVDNNINSNTQYTYMVRPMVDNKAVAISNQVTIDLNSCTVTSLINNSSTLGLILYPNPTSSILRSSKNIKWTLFSTSGQLLESNEGSVIDLSNYEKGLYLISTDNGEQVKVIKK